MHKSEPSFSIRDVSVDGISENRDGVGGTEGEEAGDKGEKLCGIYLEAFSRGEVVRPRRLNKEALDRFDKFVVRL